MIINQFKLNPFRQTDFFQHKSSRFCFYQSHFPKSLIPVRRAERTETNVEYLHPFVCFKMHIVVYFIENTFYSAMLNIVEPIRPPGISSTQFRQFRNRRNSVTIEFFLITESLEIPSDSGTAMPSLIMYLYPHPQLTQFLYGIPGIESKRTCTEVPCVIVCNSQ